MRNYRNFSKVYSAPRRAYEKERLDRELKLCGEFGLRCKREIWRVQRVLGKLRSAARFLLTLPENDVRRNVQGAAILRRCERYGLLTDEKAKKLDYVLALTVPEFLERRLQTVVFKQGLAKSVHHARCLIFQRHVAVNRQVVNVPSFLVRSGSHIDFAARSPLGGGPPGRVKKSKLKKGGEEAAEE
eukprot:TRINITY_DN2806_c0_g2_i1.p1 TRINITY_DN2806_c0_g2~~TRINITY_DN2806_c0_g2_i1.p1  ORF type:complete len:194 (-),score=44.46 TRINITY_DN2806_c0_g2_i1:473-1030(-)